jgi:hypothetical protein
LGIANRATSRGAWHAHGSQSCHDRPKPKGSIRDRYEICEQCGAVIDNRASEGHQHQKPAMMAKSAHFILFQDISGTWCAAPPGFRNPVIDPSGWGETRERAIMDLWGDADFRARAAREGWPQDSADVEFVEVQEPGFAKLESAIYLSDDPHEQEIPRRRSFKLIPGGKVTDDDNDNDMD